MIVETIVAFITFLISLVGVCFLRGPVDVDYHRKEVSELQQHSEGLSEAGGVQEE